MKFKVKDMDIATGGIRVVLVNKQDAAEMDLHHGDRVRVTAGKRSKVAVVDIGETSRAVPRGHIGLFEEVMRDLGTRHKASIKLFLEKKPKSLKYIKRKLEGHRLEKSEIREIVQDIVNDELTKVEITYFVSGTFVHGMDDEEIVNLTRAMIDTGDTLTLRNKKSL